MSLEDKMKKATSFGLILNVVLAIVAFAFILGIGIQTADASVSAAGSVVPSITSTAGGAGGAGSLSGITGAPATTAAGVPWMAAFAWAAVAFFIAPMIAEALGLETEGEIEAFQYGLTAAVFAFKAGLAFGWALGIGIVIFVVLYEKTTYEFVEFQCLPWESPIGGENCEACNDGIHPCSEYRCRSLGQACEIVNGGSANEMCVWVNPHDVTSALIVPWEGVLTEPYIYSRTEPRPPSWGTVIVPDTDPAGCITPFTPIEFGIRTDKTTQCKIAFELTEGYDEMEYYFGGDNLFSYNHTQRMTIPNTQAVVDLAEAEGYDVPEGLDLENGNEYNLYVRCTTANGFYNADPYVIRFCVDNGPDFTPPYIIETSIRNNKPVQFEIDTVPIEVYTNEVSNCRWSHDDKGFNDMENELNCIHDPRALNSELSYTCNGELTGLQDNQANDYFFRCEDQPSKEKSERNVMTESYVLNLLGTQPLNIKENSVRPANNGVVEGATTTIGFNLEVETEDGFDNGNAFCSYSFGEGNTNYIPFFQTNTNKHKQNQNLVEGTYTYNFRCVDAGGNSAETSTTFDLFVDTQAPVIVRILRDAKSLKIITNEDAICRYTNDKNTQCNFDLDENEGSAMPYQDNNIRNTHLTSWDTTKTYYIKCKDDGGKQPNPNSCSVVVSPEEI